MSPPPFSHDTGTAPSSLRQHWVRHTQTAGQPAQHTTHLGSSREVARRRKAKKAPSWTVLSWLTCACTKRQLADQSSLRVISKHTHLWNAARGAQQQAQAQVVALQAGAQDAGHQLLCSSSCQSLQALVVLLAGQCGHLDVQVLQDQAGEPRQSSSSSSSSREQTRCSPARPGHQRASPRSRSASQSSAHHLSLNSSAVAPKHSSIISPQQWPGRWLLLLLSDQGLAAHCVPRAAQAPGWVLLAPVCAGRGLPE